MCLAATHSTALVHLSQSVHAIQLCTVCLQTFFELLNIQPNTTEHSCWVLFIPNILAIIFLHNKPLTAAAAVFPYEGEE